MAAGFSWKRPNWRNGRRERLVHVAVELWSSGVRRAKSREQEDEGEYYDDGADDNGDNQEKEDSGDDDDNEDGG